MLSRICVVIFYKMQLCVDLEIKSNYNINEINHFRRVLYWTIVQYC